MGSGGGTGGTLLFIEFDQRSEQFKLVALGGPRPGVHEFLGAPQRHTVFLPGLDEFRRHYIVSALMRSYSRWIPMN